jgi:hypothetical protein
MASVSPSKERERSAYAVQMDDVWNRSDKTCDTDFRVRVRQTFLLGDSKPVVEAPEGKKPQPNKNKNKQTTMKTLKSIAGRLTKAVGLAVVLLGLGASQSHAAKIKMEVKVAGYSTAGWILVVPELRSVLGGKVRNIPEYGGWVTDRVQRGETMRLTISPSTSTERCQKGAWTGVYSKTDPNQLFTFAAVTLPYVNTATVTLNPLADNVYAYVITQSDKNGCLLFEKRVPIGTR